MGRHFFWGLGKVNFIFGLMFGEIQCGGYFMVQHNSETSGTRLGNCVDVVTRIGFIRTIFGSLNGCFRRGSVWCNGLTPSIGGLSADWVGFNFVI